MKTYFEKLSAKLVSSVEYCFLNQNYEPVNNVEMRVIGLARAGNHPIIDWIGRQFPGKRVCFVNNAQPKTNPFLTGHCQGDGYTIIFNNFLINAKYEQRMRFRKKDCLIYSYEDALLEDIADEDFEKNRERWVGKSLKRYDILILRDPFNLFASRLAAKFKKDRDIQSKIDGLVKLWKDYANEYLGRTCFLKDNPVFVNYNQWFLDRGYRCGLANKLGISFTDEGLNNVVSMGTGSSFGGQSFDGKAQEMKVLERWKHFTDDEFYRSIFADDELVALSNEVFGVIPGTEGLLIKG